MAGTTTVKAYVQSHNLSSTRQKKRGSSAELLLPEVLGGKIKE